MAWALQAPSGASTRAFDPSVVLAPATWSEVSVALVREGS